MQTVPLCGAEEGLAVHDEDMVRNKVSNNGKVSSFESVTDLVIRRPSQGCRQPKVLYTCIAALLALSAGFLALYIICRTKGGDSVCLNPSSLCQKEGCSKREDICTSPACLKISAEVSLMMDRSLDPCDSFYQFSCGGFIQSAQGQYKDQVSMFLRRRQENMRILQRGLTMVDSTSPLFVRKAERYYTQCLNNTDSKWEFIVPLLKELDVPFLSSAPWTDDHFNLTRILTTLYSKYDLGALLSVDIEGDYTGSGYYRIRLSQSNLGFYITVLKINEFLKMYRSVMQQIFAEIASFENKDVQSALKDMADVLELELRIANESMYDEEVVYKEPHNFQNFTLGDLNRMMNGMIDWVSIVNNVLEYQNLTLRVDSSTETFSVTKKGYIEFIANVLLTTPKRVLATLYGWMLLKTLYPLMPSKMYNNFHALNPETVGNQERWQNCLFDTSLAMPLTLGYLFSSLAIDHLDRLEGKRMLDDVLLEFKNSVKDLNWLEESVRRSVLNKADNVLSLIDIPDEISQPGFLEQMYATINMEGMSFVERYLALLSLRIKKKYSYLGKPFNRTRYPNLPIGFEEVNAFYDSHNNRVIVLAGIMMEPFVYRQAPRYLNFGKLGVITGHEIVHGFDSSGRYYDHFGSLKPWWSKKAEAIFLHKSNCFVNQYSSYGIESDQVTLKRNQSGDESSRNGTKFAFKVDGAKTLSENIADNGGLKFAYRAYRKWLTTSKDMDLPFLNFTKEQMFFISYAQMWCTYNPPKDNEALYSSSHTPSNFRVDGTLANFEPFSKEFNCQPGSRMNPTTKCEIW